MLTSARFFTPLIIPIILAIPLTASAQWKEPVEILGTFGAMGGEVVAVGDTLHVVADLSTLRYLRSSDNGQIWETPAYPFPDSSYTCYNPHILFTKGRLHLTCIGRQNNSYQRVYYVSSSDGGRTWETPRWILGNDTAMLKYAKLAANGDSLFLICRWGSALAFYRSTDAGGHWARGADIELGPVAVDQEPFILFSGGRLHAIYAMDMVGDTVGYEVHYRASDDLGGHWTPSVYLSTPEPLPGYRHSLGPSAFADPAGCIAVFWMDYKYGGMCAVSGEILGRYSGDNGLAWGPEIRLTETQSSMATSCIIKDGIVHVIWDDRWPEGCSYPKVLYSRSTDGGATWSPHTRVSGYIGDEEEGPWLFSWPHEGSALLHGIYRHSVPGPNYWLYYSQLDLLSAAEEAGGDPPRAVEATISTYPNPFNSVVSIKVEGMNSDNIYIYNVCGQLVKTLKFGGGKDVIVWDGTNESNKKVASGIYLFVARNSGKQTTSMALLLK